MSDDILKWAGPPMVCYLIQHTWWDGAQWHTVTAAEPVEAPASLQAGIPQEVKHDRR